MASPIPLTWNEALSGITGSISLASWFFLLIPQMIENARNGNADGVSMTFLFIWMIGDITNLAGAVWGGLIPTVIALAVYFCFADLVLIGQCMYYNTINKNKKARDVEAPVDEHAPLLHGSNNNGNAKPTPSRRLTDVTEENLGLPGSRRRSSRRTSEDPRRNSLERVFEEPTKGSSWLKNTVSILLIILVGTAGWAVAWKTGAWRPTPVGKEDSDASGPLGAEILGYTSAATYLLARVPQIIKNQRERSCEGLSLLFFMLSVMGNATYGAGILFHSVELRYFLTNLPWLIGSLGTIAEDVIIFVQFSMFGEKNDSAVE